MINTGGITLTKTPHNEANHRWTDDVHLEAQTKLYPDIFSVPPKWLEFDSVDFSTPEGEILDGRLKIDRITTVKYGGLAAGENHLYTIQERFRSVQQNPNYRDITIAKVCQNSNELSEFYNCLAQLFVYGYYDEVTGIFERAVAVNVFNLRYFLMHEHIDHSTRVHGTQNKRFATVPYKDLINIDKIIHWASDDVWANGG